MILKEDYRSIVKSHDGLITKSFKPGHELSLQLYSDKWQHHVNQFGSIYGHFPQVLEISNTKMVMEEITGKSFNELRQERYTHTLEEQCKDLKKVQFLYYKFISNLLEYNLNNNITLIHSDLNYNNMLVDSNDKLVCIDMDAVKLNRYPVENSFIAFPFAVFQHDVESLNWEFNEASKRKKEKYEN